MALEIKDLTEKELETYNNEKQAYFNFFSAGPPEVEACENWEKDERMGEKSVLLRIENERCWSKSEDGYPVFEPTPENLAKIKRFKLPKFGKELFTRGVFNSTKIGQMVKIRPCREDLNEKTFVGFYLGEIPRSVSLQMKEEGTLVIRGSHENPAIFVPALGEIIMGEESWWGKIETPEDIEQVITDDDIQKAWYVQALNALAKKDN